MIQPIFKKGDILCYDPSDLSITLYLEVIHTNKHCYFLRILWYDNLEMLELLIDPPSSCEHSLIGYIDQWHITYVHTTCRLATDVEKVLYGK